MGLIWIKRRFWEFLTEGAKTDTFKIYNFKGVLEVEIFRAKLREMKVDNYRKLYDFTKKAFNQEELYCLLL